MHHSAEPDHARHDAALIAGHAAGDLSNLDTAAAEALLTRCSSCAELHRDLIVISSATRALPPTANAPRDYRLTAEQAERLRRGSWVRGLLRPFASARSATRPIAATFTSVGVAGLLVATFVPALLGGAASAPSGDRQQAGAAATAGPTAARGALEVDPDLLSATGAPAAAGAPTANGGTAVPDGKDADASGQYVAVDGAASSDDLPYELGGGSTTVERNQPGSRSPTNFLLVGSVGLLAVGIALFGLRFAARRLR